MAYACYHLTNLSLLPDQFFPLYIISPLSIENEYIFIVFDNGKCHYSTKYSSRAKPLPLLVICSSWSSELKSSAIFHVLSSM